MEIKGLKLTTGEEIISRIDQSVGDEWNDSEKGLVLNNPRIIMIRPVTQTEMRLVLIPYVTSAAKARCFIPLSRVVTMFQPDEDMINGYLEQTSEIQLVTAGLQLNG